MLLFVNGQNHHRSSSFRTRHNDHQASFATGTNYFHLSEYRKSQDPFEFSLLTIVLGFYCHATAKQELTFRYCSLHILRRLTGFFFCALDILKGSITDRSSGLCHKGRIDRTSASCVLDFLDRSSGTHQHQLSWYPKRRCDYKCELSCRIEERRLICTTLKRP